MLTLNVNETIQWLSLQIIRTTKGKLNDTVGKVHFKAFFECNHSISFVEEISTFKKINGIWKYTSGNIINS